MTDESPRFHAASRKSCTVVVLFWVLVMTFLSQVSPVAGSCGPDGVPAEGAGACGRAASAVMLSAGPAPAPYPAASVPLVENSPASSAMLPATSISPSQASHLASTRLRQITMAGATTEAAATGELSEYSDRLLISTAKRTMAGGTTDAPCHATALTGAIPAAMITKSVSQDPAVRRARIRECPSACARRSQR